MHLGRLFIWKNQVREGIVEFAWYYNWKKRGSVVYTLLHAGFEPRADVDPRLDFCEVVCRWMKFVLWDTPIKSATFA